MKDKGAAFQGGDGLAERIAYLMAGYIRGTLTEPEHHELDQWVEASEANMRLFEELTDENNVERGLFWFQQQEAGKGEKAKVLEEIKEKAGLRRTNHFYTRLLPYAAAMILMVMVGVWLWKTNSNNDQEKPTIAVQKQPLHQTPSGAVLTLSNGRAVALDSAKKGTIGDGAFLPTQGNLVYAVTAGGAMKYHTLSVPRGEQFHLVLSDGTKVWLNAESSLHFPLAFGEERKVELKGEGYFEVAKDPEHPFIVLTADQQVEVLGTEFNINGYRDEGHIQTTLVEGRVKVEKGLLTKVLQPGQQSLADSLTLRVRNVDVKEAIAWKEGVFLFRNAPIEMVAAQIKRWYNLEVIYKGKVRGHFNATINRQESLDRLLQVMEGTGYVHFERQGNTLVIQP